MEHRCGSRRSASVEVLVSAPRGLTGTGVVCEISASGAFIRSTMPVWVHSLVSVQFPLRRRHDGVARAAVQAEVVRCTGDGFALEWLEFASAATLGAGDLMGDVALETLASKANQHSILLDELAGQHLKAG